MLVSPTIVCMSHLNHVWPCEVLGCWHVEWMGSIVAWHTIHMSFHMFTHLGYYLSVFWPLELSFFPSFLPKTTSCCQCANIDIIWLHLASSTHNMGDITMDKYTHIFYYYYLAHSLSWAHCWSNCTSWFYNWKYNSHFKCRYRYRCSMPCSTSTYLSSWQFEDLDL